MHLFWAFIYYIMEVCIYVEPPSEPHQLPLCQVRCSLSSYHALNWYNWSDFGIMDLILGYHAFGQNYRTAYYATQL